MHYKQEQLEDQLRALCDELDNELEDTFGERYPLHPNRLARGKAASVEYDGLFSTETQFTLGYGSEHGRGYVVTINICTLAAVKPEDRKAVMEEAYADVKALLPKYFPDRQLVVVHEGENEIKIIGDFSLGMN